jgi:hypothetical protein
MLRNVSHLYGCELNASDGQLGSVTDIYFDDQNWAVRYLVVETGTWLAERKVLITPHALGRLERTEHLLTVNLTRKQIEHSPSIDLHKPVSRQYEEEYYSYYGWPHYWQGGGVWGLSDFPAWEPLPLAAGTGVPQAASAGTPDRHLRSAVAVHGYHIRTTDGLIGGVSDYLVDDHGWVIRDLVVKTGSWLFGKQILIPTGLVRRIDYEDASVMVNLTKEAIEQSPAYPASGSVALDVSEPVEDTTANPRSKPISGPRSPAPAAMERGTFSMGPTLEEVSRLAYYSYINQGSHTGNDVQHWLEAEKQLRADRHLPPGFVAHPVAQ